MHKYDINDDEHYEWWFDDGMIDVDKLISGLSEGSLIDTYTLQNENHGLSYLIYLQGSLMMCMN